MNEDSHTITDAQEIDYQEIEKAVYRALSNYKENNIQASTSDSDLVEFNTSTDARLFTVGTAAPPTSSAEQTTIILYDIRNIIFLFLSVYLVITVYSRIKNAVLHLYKKGD